MVVEISRKIKRLNEVKELLEIESCFQIFEDIAIKIYDNDDIERQINFLIIEIKKHEIKSEIENSIDLVCSLL